MLATGMSVVGLALIGLGLGAALRSTAGALVSVVALLFVLPGVTGLLPAPWNTWVSSVMLSNLVSQIAGEDMSFRLGDGALSPAGALVAMALYAAVPLAAGTLLIIKRDVLKEPP